MTYNGNTEIVMMNLIEIASKMKYKVVAKSSSKIQFKKGGFFSLRTNGSTSHITYNIIELDDGSCKITTSFSATQGGGLARLAPDLSGDADTILIKLEQMLNNK